MCAVLDNNIWDGESPSYGRGDGIEPSGWVTQTRRDTLKDLLGIGTGVTLFGNASLGSTSTDGTTEYDNLCFTPATVLAERIRTGELSSEHLVELFLDRIERRDDDINAFVTLTPDRARKAAREADRAVERGEYFGPLHGVPFANKDTYPVKGMRHTDGSLLFEDRIAEENDKRAYRSSSTRGDPQEERGGGRRRACPLCDRRRRGRFNPHSGFVYRNLWTVPAADNPGDFGSPSTFSRRASKPVPSRTRRICCR